MKTIEHFEEQIQTLLAEETEAHRLEWLCDHLREYLERWLGFARAPQIAVESTVSGDLFMCALAAINLVDRELETSPKIKQTAAKRWSEFRNAVEWIRRAPNRDDLKLIESTFIAFGNSALGKEFTINAG
jgi:hypothetical protein